MIVLINKDGRACKDTLNNEVGDSQSAAPMSGAYNGTGRLTLGNAHGGRIAVADRFSLKASPQGQQTKTLQARGRTAARDWISGWRK